MFTDSELAAFFRAADSIAPGTAARPRVTIPVIFRLIRRRPAPGRTPPPRRRTSTPGTRW